MQNPGTAVSVCSPSTWGRQRQEDDYCFLPSQPLQVPEFHSVRDPDSKNKEESNGGSHTITSDLYMYTHTHTHALTCTYVYAHGTMYTVYKQHRYTHPKTWSSAFWYYYIIKWNMILPPPAYTILNTDWATPALIWMSSWMWFLPKCVSYICMIATGF